jgi:hypothetical protein
MALLKIDCTDGKTVAPDYAEFMNVAAKSTQRKLRHRFSRAFEKMNWGHAVRNFAIAIGITHDGWRLPCNMFSPIGAVGASHKPEPGFDPGLPP